MAFTFFGQTPSTTTTVSASPTPTTTVFTVVSITNFVEGQYLTVEVSGNDERCQIQSIAGSQITLTAPLSGVPSVPGAVKSGRELLTNSKLSHGWVGIAASISDLASTSLANAVSYLKAHLPGYGMYMISNVSQPSDNEFVVTNGSRQWEMELPNLPLIESMIQEYCSPLLNEIEILRTEVDRLNALSVNTFEEIIVRDTLYIPQLTTGTGTEITVQVAPTILSELRATDMVSLQSFPVPAGILVGGVSLQGGYVSIKIWNPTAGSITPGFTPVIIKIERVSS